ncbi:MAG: hypothetical protein AAF612_06415 [Planctomycetota bacterium]
MNGFERLMRNLGLMVHNVRNPEPRKSGRSGSTPASDEGAPTGAEVSGGGKVIVRRTTIEEVEVRPDSMD